MKEMVVAENLVKRFRTKERLGLFKSRVKVVEALRGVSFKAHRGEVFGLLGPNGAGKTTTIKILTTLLLPDGGRAYVAGYDVVREAAKVRENIGVMLYVEKGLYNRLTGRENLEYYGYLQHMPGSEVRRRVNYLLELVDMTEHADKLVEEYSLGMKARISFARALLTDAPILFLDEPTLGLDPVSARKMREVILRLRDEGRTIILTTHNMWEAEQLLDRVAIINRGRILEIGTPQELKSRIEKEAVAVIDVRGRFDGIDRYLRERVDVSYVKVVREDPVAQVASLRIGMGNGGRDVLPRIIDEIVSRGLKIENVKVEEPSLEDVFIVLTQGGGA